MPARTLRLAPSALPPRVVLLCADGPQHRYLAALLARSPGLAGVVVETGEAQKRRLRDAGFRRGLRARVVHEWRQRLLGYRRHRRRYFAALEPEWPDLPTVRPPWINAAETAEALDRWRPDVTVVCGTSIIRPEILARAGHAVNVHAGVLPGYRGNQCFFMALYEADYDGIGASLHLVTPELDAGPVLAVVRPPMGPGDHEESLYSRSMHRAALVLADLLSRLAAGEALPVADQAPGGRTFRNADRRLRHDVRFLLLRLSGRRRCPTRSDFRVTFPS
ncbi:formyl transferase [Actinomadura sp. 9N215]|uniref:formyl transferase n=1 Tax=Actinomadura sp. 9N215 TaxID=3375150 RepID=UPI00379BA7E0